MAEASWDGLIEWVDGYTEPVINEFFEELHIKNGTTIDIHGHYFGYRNVAIARGDVGLLIESAIMPAVYTGGPNHASYITPNAQDLADFGDSLTLDAFNFWQLAIDIPGIPTHQHSWWY